MSTTTDIRIDLPMKEMLHRRNVEMKECYLILGETTIDYRVVGWYESDENDEGIWKEYKANWRCCRNKRDLSDVSMYYDNKIEMWNVELEYSGVSDSRNCWCWDKTEEREAFAVYKQIRDYMKR